MRLTWSVKATDAELMHLKQFIPSYIHKKNVQICELKDMCKNVHNSPFHNS